MAWKAQVRLCARYRRMLARRKKAPVVITAIARELVGFIWRLLKSRHHVQLTNRKVQHHLIVSRWPGRRCRSGGILHQFWERQRRSPRVRPRQPHDAHLACGNQSADEKLLNRRICAGALTSAPGLRPSPRVPRAGAETMLQALGLDNGHKKIARRNTPRFNSTGICSSRLLKNGFRAPPCAILIRNHSPSRTKDSIGRHSGFECCASMTPFRVFQQHLSSYAPEQSRSSHAGRFHPTWPRALRRTGRQSGWRTPRLAPRSHPCPGAQQ